MGPEAVAALRSLPTEWYADGETFEQYVGDGLTYDAATETLVFDLGWVTWNLRGMMNVLAALKDRPGTDVLEHSAPTYDAWYERGRFFIEPGRWGYVGSGDWSGSGLDPKLPDGPARPLDPTVADVETWNRGGPIVRTFRLDREGRLELDTYDRGLFRVGSWNGALAPLRERGLAGVERAGGGAVLRWVSDDGATIDVDLKTLWDCRER
jgi:hypothetical protein